MTNSQRLTSKNWFAKVAVAAIFGFLLAIGVEGLILRVAFGDIFIFSTKGQFLMWLTAPIWLAVLSLSFLFRSGFEAALKLGIANVMVWGLVYVSQFMQG